MQHKQITLRPTERADLDYFFRFQLDEEAHYLAAFTAKSHTDKRASVEKYTRHMHDPTIRMHAILVGEAIAGSIAKVELWGDAEITYWLDRRCWSQGIATTALRKFLALETTRPLFGRVAFDNFGSQRTLETCGFIKIGTDRGFANARQTEIEEFTYKLA